MYLPQFASNFEKKMGHICGIQMWW